MSVHIAAPVWKLLLPTLDKFVLLKLADCANDEGENAYPAVATIARETGMSVRSVQRSLGNLLREGILEQSKPSSPTFPAIYRIRTDRGVTQSPVTRGHQGGVTQARGGVTQSPKPSVEPSVEPSVAALVLPTKTVPDTKWVQDMRDKFSSRLRDFDETLEFFMNTNYYRTCTDKKTYLSRKMEAAARREADSTQGRLSLSRSAPRVVGEPKGIARL